MKGLKWGLFSGTATYCAFFLPVLFYRILVIKPETSNATMNQFLYFGFIIVTYWCALYHSLYRLKTVVFDLGASKKIQKITDILCDFLLICGSIVPVVVIVVVLMHGMES